MTLLLSMEWYKTLIYQKYYKNTQMCPTGEMCALFYEQALYERGYKNEWCMQGKKKKIFPHFLPSSTSLGHFFCFSSFDSSLSSFPVFFSPLSLLCLARSLLGQTFSFKVCWSLLLLDYCFVHLFKPKPIHPGT